jgi:hypothetical protein
MFRKMVGDWASKKQKSEAEDFLRRIRTADGSDLGLSVASVLHVAEMYRQGENWDLFEPASVIASDFNAVRTLSSTAQQMQKEGNLIAAGALMVWVHSLRGIENFEVRPQAREIWKHLSRGFPYAHDGAEMIYNATGIQCSLDRLGRVPSGLSADVQG